MEYAQKSFDKMRQAEDAYAKSSGNDYGLMWLRIAFAIVYAINNVANAIREGGRS